MRTRTLRAAFALALAVLILTPGVASAASQSAHCQRDVQGGPYHGYGWTYYHYSGGYDYIDYFRYQITAPALTKHNNVHVQQMLNSWQADTELYRWNSPDDRWTGTVYTHYPTRTVRIAGSSDTHSTYHFIFDRANWVDPSCSAETRSW
jgi:hypothetical protein